MHRRLQKSVQPIKSLPSIVRIIVGVLLLLGGIFGALPVLGFWMAPLGLLVLSWDFRWARRGYLSLLMWFRRRRKLTPPRENNGAPARRDSP